MIIPRNRSQRWAYIAVMFVLSVGLFCPCSLAKSITVGRAGNAIVAFDRQEGLGGIQITVNGVCFRPLAGAAAIGADGKPDSSIPLTVDAQVTGDVLRLTITSSHGQARGIDPGLVQGLGEWRRLDLSRYAGPYGQTWWPKTTFSVKGDFWFTAHWVMEESDGTDWKAPNQSNRGSTPFPAALQVHYSPDTEGDYLPIREVLELRFASRLWDVVPPVRQQPSEYREFLARSVFVDLWGGQPVSQLEHFLKVLEAISQGTLSYYIILQNWETGGWDSLLPDSMWLPEYPPNPSVGTVQELRELCDLGKSMGRFGFRTNYRILRDCSPSFRRDMAHYAVESDRTRRPLLRCADWLPVARRGDTEIHRQFAPTAAFTDQMTSGAAPWNWHDYAASGGSRSMRSTLDHQKALAELIKDIHGGPLSSETLIDQHLLGEFVDTGDFGIQNGHGRLFSPEYKLRRLHRLSGFHGVGLMYRFYEMPPFESFRRGTTTFRNDPVQLDDYRACQILFGNGGYVCHDFANWRYYLTECLLIGNLQKHYCGQPVREVRYWHQGRWVTLDDYVRQGSVPNIVPWLAQTDSYGRVRIEYRNGLTAVVNRLADVFTVADAGVVLPRFGWVAWMGDDSLLAFSAYWPGTQHRVDYLRDDRAKVQYLDPRDRETLGVSTITMWKNGQIVISADPDRNRLVVDGRTLQLDLPTPPPRKSPNSSFQKGLDGWRPIRGILRAETRGGNLVLNVIAPDAFIHSPLLALGPNSTSAIDIRMRIQGTEVASGGLYFATGEAPSFAPDKLVTIKVIPDGQFHTYRVNVGSHPKWRGQTITGLRLDPARGTSDAEISIEYIRTVGPKQE